MIQQCAMVRINEALRNLGEHVKLSHAKPRWYIVSQIYIHTCLQSRGGIQGCFTVCGVTALMYMSRDLMSALSLSGVQLTVQDDIPRCLLVYIHFQISSSL